MTAIVTARLLAHLARLLAHLARAWPYLAFYGAVAFVAGLSVWDFIKKNLNYKEDL